MFDVKRLSFDRLHKFYTLCLEVCTLLLYISEYVKGVVEIAPSEVAVVCRAEHQLEVICNTSSVVHTWQLIANPDSGTVTRLRQVSSIGSTGADSAPLIINSTIMITFSRLSSQGSFPLISRMTINPVTESLNGSRVNCVDDASSESATATILIIGAIPPAKPSIQSHSEQFLSKRIVVILEWTLSNSLNHQQLLLPNVTINIVPDPEVEIMFFGNMSVQLTLSYNILHNVSITQPGICEQPNQTAFIELSYTKCYNPTTVRAVNLIIEGYDDPALEGAIITFDCHDGLTLIGPNSSTCMNGEWEPDPSEANCITGLVTAGVTTGVPTVTISTCSNPLYVLQIKDPSVSTVNVSMRSEFNKTPVCCSGFLITESNRTTCLENGEWELETLEMKEMPDRTTAMLRTALITVICSSIMVSALIFIIGFVCGHYFSQRWKTSATSDQNKGNVSNTTNERGEDLELKENVAYITLRPK